MKFNLLEFLMVLCVCLIENTIAANDEVKVVPPSAEGSSPQTTTLLNQDWPGIRGPRWNGISDDVGLSDSWPAEGPPVLWTRELGQGYSAFVAWSNRIATQYQSLRGQYVICLDADTGHTIWEYRYDWPYDPAGVYPGPRATPMYKDGLLYFASPAGLVGCLAAETGTLKWSVELANNSSATSPGSAMRVLPP